MLKTIAQFLRGGDRVQFTLMRDGIDGVKLLITPVLAAEDDSSDDRAKQIRAMLARPLLIKATVDTLDTDGLAALNEAAGLRAEVAASYETLMSELRKDVKTAAKLTEPKADSPKKTVKAAKTPAAAVESAGPGEDDDGAGSDANAAAQPQAQSPAAKIDLFGDA